MISMLTISIFTYVVYMLANKILAVQMHIKFLVLCALCAFSMSLILPRMFVGIIGLAGTSCIIILFGIISSYFIALYYDAELQKALAQNTLASDPMEISEAIEPDEQDYLPSTSIMFNLENVQEIPTSLEMPAEPLLITECLYPIQDEGPIEDEELAAPENIVQLPIPEIPLVATEIEVKEYFYPIPKKCFYPVQYKEKTVLSDLEKIPIIQQQEEITEVFDVAVETKTETEIPNEIMDVNSEAIQADYHEESLIQENLIIETLESVVSLDSEQESFISEEILEEEISKDIYPSSTDLDALLDIAFLQKEQQDFSQALITFRRALFLYPNSEVSPFLVIEIGTIFKNLGSYDEAIQAFSEGRLLPGIINNKSLDQEFINNIAYLRVVKNNLIKNSLEFTPLSQVPSSVLKEIDDEFSLWRSNLNI